MRPGGQVTVRAPVGMKRGVAARAFLRPRWAKGATAYHPYPHVMAAGQAAIGNIQGAPLRQCSCGQARENRGPGSREVFTCLGPVALRRRWWGSRCSCSPGGYHADAVLGLDGGLSPRLQRKACRMAADLSFDRTREHLRELLGVSPASETLRVYCERQAARVARWQGRETGSAAGFRTAPGGWEFTIDAGKVNTREKGWRDLKIAVAQKRPTAEPATPTQWESRDLPDATARVMWADISAAERFRRSWWAR